MRPNIDISHTLGGRVKDYAEANDIDLSKAYSDLLDIGLRAAHPDGITEFEAAMLRMEDLIEERIEIDKEACEDKDVDWQKFYDGECSSCERAWELPFMMPSPENYPDHRYKGHHPANVYSDTESQRSKDLCIPCWREKMGYPKLSKGQVESRNEL